MLVDRWTELKEYADDIIAIMDILVKRLTEITDEMRDIRNEEKKLSIEIGDGNTPTLNHRVSLN